MLKRCSSCRTDKELHDFHRRSQAPDGRNSYCKQCKSLKAKEYFSKKSDYYKSLKKSYREKNSDSISEYFRKYYLKNKTRLQNSKNKRYSEDLNFKLSRLLRVRLNSALKENRKTGSSIRDLGCSIQELKVYLESKFQSGMTWENHGKWHIDHIKPLASFDLTDKNQFLQAVNFSNLQPLWAEDNLRKGAM